MSDQNKRNLSAALKSYYLENPKQSYKHDAARYANQLDHIKEIAKNQRDETWARLNAEIPQLLSSWAQNCEIFLEEQKIKISAHCQVCSSQIVRQLGTFKKHAWQSSICHTCNPPLRGAESTSASRQ